MTAFATVEEFGAMLGRTFAEGTEAAQAEQLLEDASDHLRDVIGQEITAGTTTYTDVVPVDARDGGRLTLPQQPVRSVDAVLVNGTAWSRYELVDGQLLFDPVLTPLYPVGRVWVPGTIKVTVTYSHGLTAIPSDLSRWTRVLAAQALAQLETFGSIGNAGLTSARIDDFAENYATGAASEAFSLPTAVADRFRGKYSRSAFAAVSPTTATNRLRGHWL